jgi:hypothetical protein
MVVARTSREDNFFMKGPLKLLVTIKLFYSP